MWGKSPDHLGNPPSDLLRRWWLTGSGAEWRNAEPPLPSPPPLPLFQLSSLYSFKLNQFQKFIRSFSGAKAEECNSVKYCYSSIFY